MADLINEDLIINIVENSTGDLDGKRVTRQGGTQSLSGEMTNIANLTVIISEVIQGLMPVKCETMKSAIQQKKSKTPVELDNTSKKILQKVNKL